MTTLSHLTAILNVIADARGPLSVSEVSRRTALPRSTAHRVLQDLEGQLYIVRAKGGYRLGPAVVKFGLAGHLNLVRESHSVLVALARETHAQCELAIFSGREVVVVDQILFAGQMRAVTQLGKSFSLHASSLGKAVLAGLSEREVRALLPKELPKYTDRTITDVGELVRHLDGVREAGVAYDRDEHTQGISSVAKAFVGGSAWLQAVSVVAPTSRFALRYREFAGALERHVGPLASNGDHLS